MDDVMQQEWCCLTCSSKFTFGKLRTKPGSPHLHCPVCGSSDIHPADGTSHAIAAKLGS